MEEKYKENNHLLAYEGAVAIITGAASGIGRALAKRLAEKGARAIVIVDRQLEVANQVAEELRKITNVKELRVYQVDVRDFTEMQRVVDETIEAYGRLDYMFNNAGVVVGGPIEKIGVDDFNYVLDVNIRGVVNGVQAAYPHMKQQGFGHIVNTSSCAGLMPCGEGFAPYSTSKYAICGLSTTLRVEAARHGVRVSVVCPGVVDTPMLHGGVFCKDLSGIPQEEIDKLWAKWHPMDPNDFAKRVLKSVAKNKPIIIVPGRPGKFMWFLNRMSPSLGLYLTRKANDKGVKKLAKFKKTE